MTADLIQVIDDVLVNPHEYRAAALAQSFQTIPLGDDVWHGIALLDRGSALPQALQMLCPAWGDTRLTFFRQSPLGQAEPNFIHSDDGMGELTAIFYLHPYPPPGDGTTFWRYRPTGAIAGHAEPLPKDAESWEPWRTVEARFNRLLVFAAPLFHSRAIRENYGQGDDARLIQVAFGSRATVLA